MNGIIELMFALLTLLGVTLGYLMVVVKLQLETLRRIEELLRAKGR